jgi:hypothetical protein
MRWLLLALLALTLTGCSLREWLGLDRPATPPPPAAPPPAPPPLEDAPADPAAALRAERDELRALLAGVESRLKAAEIEKTLAPLRTLTAWAAYIGMAVALLSVVGLVLLKVGVGLPMGGRLIAGIGAAGLALAACAVGLGQSLPWLAPVGLGLLLLLVLACITWAALTWRRAGARAAGEWKTYAGALPPEIRERLDAESRRRQGRDADLVDVLLGPARPASNPDHG